MLWEYRVEVVFMVCREYESNKTKCHRYWPKTGEPAKYGDVDVTLEEEVEIFPDFTLRKLCARCGGLVHHVKQFHYSGWPDHGIPKDSHEIFKMVGKMREERKHLQIPVVIHCSAGCGRTGTICAVDYFWTSLHQGKVSHGFSLYDIIIKFREQRQSMVQTPEQYEFVHLVVQSLCQNWLEEFQEHNYENTGFHSDDIVSDNTSKPVNKGNIENADNVYQEISTATSVPIPQPYPAPRPTRPLPEINNNDPKKVKVKHVDLHEAMKNLTDSHGSNSGSTVTSKSGHSTVISVGAAAKPPLVQLPTRSAVPTHHPPPPPQSQTSVHRNAVLNLSHGQLVTEAHAKPGVPRKMSAEFADIRSMQRSVSQLDDHSTAEYGVVVKDSAKAKITNYPEQPQALIEGWKKEQNSSCGFSEQSTEEGPSLPSRNYDPEDLNRVPHPVFSTGALGVVRAMGGVPAPNHHGQTPHHPHNVAMDRPKDTESSRPMMALPSNSSTAVARAQPTEIGSVYEEIHSTRGMLAQHAGAQRAAHNPIVITTAPHVHHSRNPIEAVRGGVRELLGKGGRSQPAQVTYLPSYGQYMYKNKNISFPNRGDKPAKPRSHKFMTSL